MLLRTILNRTNTPEPDTPSLRDKIHNNIINRRNSIQYGHKESEYLTASSSLHSSRSGSEDREESPLQARYGADDYGYNGSTIDQYLEDQNKKFNELIDKNLEYVGCSGNLVEFYKLNEFNDNEIEIFLQKLNKETKAKLRAKLNEEVTGNQFDKYHLGIDENFTDEMFLNNLTLLEKFEIILIFTVKLNFLIIKYSLPVSKYFYRKFINNQLILLNSKNFNKVLNLFIKLMTNLDNNLQNNNFEEKSLNDLEEFEVQLDNITFERPSLWKTLYNIQVVGLYRVAEEFAKQL